MNKNRRDGPIIAGGIALSIVVSFLTVFAVMMVVNKLNDDADAAYAAALTGPPSLSSVATIPDTQAPASSGVSVPGDSVIQTPDITPDITPSDNTDEPADSEDPPVSVSPSTVPDETIPVDAQAPEETSDSNTENETDSGNTDAGLSNTDVQAPDTSIETNSDETDGQDDTQPGSTTPVDGGSADGTAGVTPDYTYPEEDGTTVYLIEYGDTLSKISKMFGVSIEDIAAYNNIADVNRINAGATLKIPAVSGNMNGDKSHVSVNTGPEDG